MHSHSLTALSIVALALNPSVVARDVPTNVLNFYNRVKSDQSCPHELQGGFYGTQGGPKSFSYCQDQTSGVLYLHGAGGQLANMDVDCDGQQGGAGEDGRCGSSGDTQSQTSFKDTVASYGAGINDLNAKVHPFVVFGNDGNNPSFDPKQYGIQPLSVMAVVCANQLIYGVWGDTNGNDGPPVIGEASISLATACYGTSINGNSGHDENDVLYVAFPGTDAVPGAGGAKWNVQSYDDFEESIQALGDKLIARL
ncbi:glycoside hydrolase family 75 protein [Didymella exigua CBS 183.55]|uniref:Endo-chitosanase n=1 Tax=Didymella exigua CBS 183.55 TaxID=1150837 RepID=A0A6A5RQ67_9PLEO|nr:glycoside hydrolase family 75 protein [Didymella exigua CBS 183.55]KAF1928456.1 glycoside hydrolase family 75 protein [Didymella exigua CBS 183.55]